MVGKLGVCINVALMSLNVKDDLVTTWVVAFVKPYQSLASFRMAV